MESMKPEIIFDTSDLYRLADAADYDGLSLVAGRYDTIEDATAREALATAHDRVALEVGMNAVDEYADEVQGTLPNWMNGEEGDQGATTEQAQSLQERIKQQTADMQHKLPGIDTSNSSDNNSSPVSTGLRVMLQDDAMKERLREEILRAIEGRNGLSRMELFHMSSRFSGRVTEITERITEGGESAIGLADNHLLSAEVVTYWRSLIEAGLSKAKTEKEELAQVMDKYK